MLEAYRHIKTELRRKAHIITKPKAARQRSSGRRQHRSQTAIDGEYLTGDVLAGVAGEENRGAFR
jgi:hypothetical protein